ncbi:hypothetical protein ABH937_006138 [Kitasatospora sp. GAS1066B]
MPSEPPTLAAMIELPSTEPSDGPRGSLDRPFDRLEALAGLAALGRQLDHQATRPGGATVAELDTTLTVMRAVHGRIVAELGAALKIS